MEIKGQIVKNFLRASQDRFAILHLKDVPELSRMRFWGTEQLKRLGDYDKVMKLENYELVYIADFENFPELIKKSRLYTLQAIYDKFNIDHPADYKAHSLSVSDVVVLHQGDINTIHYVDSFGFTELPQFLEELEAE